MNRNFIIRAISALVLLPLGVVVFKYGSWVTVAATAILSVLAFWEGLKMLKPKQNKTEDLLILFLSLVGIIGSISYLSFKDPKFVFITCVCIWCTDIFAYIGGKILGGPKLIPKVSPGKTWSGSITGLVFGCIVPIYILQTQQTPLVSGFSIPLLLEAFIFFLLSILSQIGDLMESRFKRYCGVKDSGFIIPGHGGVLDRFDGFLLTMPFCALLVYFCGLFRVI